MVKTVYELTMKIEVSFVKLKYILIFIKIDNTFIFSMHKQQNDVILYQPGDTIGILPVNPDAIVHEIIDRDAELKAKSKLPITLTLAESTGLSKKLPKMPTYLPTHTTTIFKLLKETIDLNVIPKKAFLGALVRSNCVTDSVEKRFLEILASREGAAIYVSDVLQSQLSFHRLFGELKSMSFSVNSFVTLLEHLPRLMPRPYSISTSSLATKSLIEYDRHSTVIKMIFSVNDPPGITTQLLEHLIFKYQVENTLRIDSNEEKVNLYVRQSNRFRLCDDDFDRSLIMIAIGTGIAPFIGFLEHRREQMKKWNRPAGRTWLLFGCRQKANQLCRAELKEFIATGVLNQLSETFSRDMDVEGDRYVQDKLKANADEFVTWISHTDAGTKIFVCGNNKMAQNVRCAIEECLTKVKKMSAIEAKKTVDELIKNGRYVEDIWI